jgi:DNA (cytosine-5)-methyltransferase 1
MIYGSVCSGIEAATAAWHPLGWRPAFFSEIAAFPRAVLQHHYPEVPLHGDFTTIEAGDYAPIDLLVGGTPCQSFSVAGLRGGLGDDRGNLALEYLRLADRLRPRWLVWENVPGVLSSNGGRDFGAILGGMVELGYGFAYRVLDAQFFGVAQRRRRVFVVGHSGDWRRAAAVLLERHSLQGHPAPRREAGQGTAISPSLRAQGNSSHRADSQAFVPDVAVHAFGGNDTRGPIDVATACNAHGGPVGRLDFESETFIAFGWQNSSAQGDSVSDFVFPALDKSKTPAVFDPNQITSKANGSRCEPGLSHTLPATANAPVAFNITPSNSNKDYNARLARYAQAITAGSHRTGARGGDLVVGGDVSPTLRAGGNSTGGHRPPGTDVDTVETLRVIESAVRRLTPRECERLQGFPDDFTAVPYRGKPAADGPRYKALGNSMAVPCMAWIGRRIAMVDALDCQPEAQNPQEQNT